MYALRGLTIDNGGSEVRSLPLGKTVKEGMATLSNDFVCISQRNFRIKEVEDKLGLCNIIKAPGQEYIGIVARGTTGKMYTGDSIALDNTQTKTSNVNYYKQFIYAVAHDAMSAKMEEVTKEAPKAEAKAKLFSFLKQGEVVNAQKVDGYDYVITTCIPIKEHSGDIDCARKLKESIIGDYEVIFPLLPSDNKVTFKIRKENVGVVPEGGVAIAGLRKKIGKEDFTVLSDLGHVTNDLAVFKGVNIYGKTLSSKWAGSILIANIADALVGAGYVVSEDQVGKIIETGYVMRGKNEVDVSSIIKEQKRLFAVNNVKKDLLQLLRLNTLDPQQIQNFVPMGAPMNESKRTGSLAKLVKDGCGLSGANVEVMSDDLRYVNIEQASMFTQLLFAKAEQVLVKSE